MDVPHESTNLLKHDSRRQGFLWQNLYYRFPLNSQTVRWWSYCLATFIKKFLDHTTGLYSISTMGDCLSLLQSQQGMQSSFSTKHQHPSILKCTWNPFVATYSTVEAYRKWRKCSWSTHLNKRIGKNTPIWSPCPKLSKINCNYLAFDRPFIIPLILYMYFEPSK